ncbi:hypothetical protein AB0B66_30385 [Catellatospora sp. NPDC049111]|uniref:hypothetical protein n=1 Tax=Catellatospora sp. NPDC049111 TaxID=3155271 RepID=UPI0034013306
MMISLASAIRASLEFGSPEDRIVAAKDAVTRHLLAVDGRVRVRQTEYFNHSVAPDIVVTWPRERRERYLYLRPSTNPQWLAQDLRWIAENKPIVMSLDPEPTTANTDMAAVGHQALVADTLLVDPTALDEFAASHGPLGTLLAHAVLQGGRGLVDQIVAREAGFVAAAGFAGAQQLAAQPIRDATEFASTIFAKEHASRITRILRAVWEGHGGSALDFPSVGTLSGPLTAEDIEVLLASVDTEDRIFWRRVGRTITLAMLTSLTVADPCPNLGWLVMANIDRLSARALRVQAGQPTLFHDNESRWTIARNCLLLRGEDWLAYFAARIDDLPPGAEYVGIDLFDLREQAARRGQTVTDLTVERPDLAITFESTTESNVVDSEDLASMAIRGHATARRASVALHGGRAVKIDFLSATAGGATSASFTLADLGYHALPLLLHTVVGPLADFTVDLAEAGFGEDPAQSEPEPGQLLIDDFL